MKRIVSVFLLISILIGIFAGCAISVENGEFTTGLEGAVLTINKELKDNGLQELPMPEKSAGQTAQINYSLGDIEIILIAGELTGCLKKVMFLNNTLEYTAYAAGSNERMLDYARCFIKVLDSMADVDKIAETLEFQNVDESGVRNASTEHCKYSLSGGSGARLTIEAK